ncbi:MAG: NADPH-dependent F420 reductase [Anaerolineales bacterium]|nr:NADPH-dependent F420 reductase [Anaerolineales bacterium]
MKIAILGGTGAEGSGLGFRWAAAGHDVLIGSRTAEKALAAAAELNPQLPENAPRITGHDNLAAAEAADLVVLSVPYAAQEATLHTVKPALVGKILLSVVVPLMPPKVARVWHPAGGSAAEEAQALLGEEARVIAAFQNISAHHLLDLSHEIECDVLICGEKAADKEVVAQLCAEAGMRGVNAGALANASVAEGLTAVLIGINIRHKIKNAGIRITGI